jgi:hypothetical protein
LGEAHIRDIIAILIAVLVEIGSALGLTLMVLATRPVLVSPQPVAHKVAASEPTAKARPAARSQTLVVLPETPADLITRWALSRLDVLSTGRIQAEIAYQDFIAWCQAEDLNACSRQMFGRRFAEVVTGMGGRKVRINGRAYYEGVVLQRGPVQRRSLTVVA